MKKKHLLIIILSFMFLQSCVGSSVKENPCGIKWINIHKNNSDLIGIYVQQLPDNSEYEADYVNKHPVTISYLFKGDRAHTVTYTPTGQIQDGEWWDVPKDSWLRKGVTKDFRPNSYCN